MRVAIHFPDMESPPAGIWWQNPDGKIQSFYLEEGSDAVKGRQTMSAFSEGTDWNWWVTSLQRRTPYFSVWEKADIGVDFTPQEYLEMLVRVAERQIF